MKKGTIYEPFIVTIDDRYGGFEIVYWCQTEEEARKYYEELDKEPWQEYPDKQDRHKRLWKIVESSVTHESRSKMEVEE